MNWKAYIAATVLLAASISTANAAACSGPSALVEARNFTSGAGASYREYVRFKFKKPSTATTTGAVAATGPFTDTSGANVPVAGAMFTQITFNTPNWMCSVPVVVSAGKPIIKGIKIFDQFEGQINFAIGRAAGTHFVNFVPMACGAAFKCWKAAYKF